tara:strand:+ start:156 stop:449 length:294 start_codon:yes stop_codon:yes gene_type:complete
MSNKIKETTLNILKVLYILLVLFIAYQVLLAIIGGTWPTENIIVAGIGIIIAGIFSIFGLLMNQSKHIGILGERTKNIGNSLNTLGNDFKKHLVNHK